MPTLLSLFEEYIGSNLTVQGGEELDLLLLAKQSFCNASKPHGGPMHRGWCRAGTWHRNCKHCNHWQQLR